MNDAQLLDQLSMTDALAPDTDMPEQAWPASTARSEIERRIGMHTQTPKRTVPAADPNRRRPWAVALGAFALVVIVGALGFGLATWGSEEPTTTTSIPVENLEEDAREAYAAVEEAHATATLEDYSAWALASNNYTTSADIANGQAIEEEYRATDAATNARTEYVGCVSHGYSDEWPSAADQLFGDTVGFSFGPAATGYRFTCTRMEMNDFHGAVGISFLVTEEWVVADAEVIQWAELIDERGGAAEDFEREFRDWMEERHPEVAASLTYITYSNHPDAASMPTAMGYVAAFASERSD